MSPQQERKKILIVEDEESVVAYLEMMLQDAGFETISAADGQQGIEAVKREKPDLVTLDVSMPEASGTRFYKEVRTDPELASIPVIIVTAITGYGGDPSGYEKFLKGRQSVPAPEGFFSKPIDREPFLDRVKELLTPTS